MKALFIALASLLLFPIAALGGDQVIPNGVLRVGADAISADASAVNVAVVDTGIDTTHPDLNVVGGVDCSPKQDPSPFANTLSFVTQDVKDATNPFGPIDIAPDAPGYQDGMGHGTHVAGTIGALDNSLGVVGVAPGVNLYAVRVLSSTGAGTAESVVCGLEWIARNHERMDFDVVNMSLGVNVGGETPPLFGECGLDYSADPRFVGGGPVTDPSLSIPSLDEQLLLIHEAVCAITALGIPVVVAAGNDDGSASFNVPATFQEVITVSNFSDFDGKPGGLGENVACPDLGGWDDALWTHWNGTPDRAFSSSNGVDVDIAAPGTCILSTVPGMGVHGGGYATATGTSMAAPHVTGLIALYKARCPDASLEEVRDWLINEAADDQLLSFSDTDEFFEPTARFGFTGCE
jgi:subtilisin